MAETLPALSQASAQSPRAQRPPRALGVALAILLSVLLYTVIPLMLLWIDLSIQGQFENLINVDIPYPDGSDGQAFAVGGTANIVSTPRLIFDVVTGLGFLVIALFAWRGRPSWIRFLMLAAIATMTALNVLSIFMSLRATPSLDAGFTSGDGLVNSLLLGRLMFTVLIPAFAAWYLNRGPARAFYRGYYLPEPESAD